MEFVPLSDEALRVLARQDLFLKRVFQGVYPEDRLPKNPSKTTRCAYIVNTDPQGEPGEHWLGIWTEQGHCELFDSFGLPFGSYSTPELDAWLDQWPAIWMSTKPLQAFHSQACGSYAFLFLQARAEGQSLEDFLARFHDHKFVQNDQKVGQTIKRIVQEDLKEIKGQQKCLSRHSVEERHGTFRKS